MLAQSVIHWRGHFIAFWKQDCFLKWVASNTHEQRRWPSACDLVTDPGTQIQQEERNIPADCSHQSKGRQEMRLPVCNPTALFGSRNLLVSRFLPLKAKTTQVLNCAKAEHAQICYTALS